MAGVFAHGTVFSVTLNSTLTAVGDLTSISGVELSADDIDMTSHDSDDAWREFSGGLKDGGTVSIEGNFTNDSSQTGLLDLVGGEPVAMTIAFPDSKGTWSFNGYLNAFSTDAPMDDKITFSATIKVSGEPALA